MLDYQPEHYNRACENIEDFVEIHPWMKQLIRLKVKEVLNEMTEEPRSGKEMLEFLTDEFLGAMVIGIQMGEDMMVDHLAEKYAELFEKETSNETI